MYQAHLVAIPYFVFMTYKWIFWFPFSGYNGNDTTETGDINDK